MTQYPDLQLNGSRRCFNAMVTALDESVGIIVDSLRSAALYDNSIIVYSSKTQHNNTPHAPLVRRDYQRSVCACR